ncbi:filamentous hemagglutinin N-terminal domain-containing protein [Xanthobacter sp. DSM 14520]
MTIARPRTRGGTAHVPAIAPSPAMIHPLLFHSGRTFTRGRGLRLSGALAASTALASLLGAPAFAAPQGGSVVAGSATISSSGTTTTIDQSSNKAIINWTSFSVGKQETVDFNQPSASSVTLNRVIGNEGSVIAGAINANGQVFIVNSNGILFTGTSQVNVGGLVASTLDISNQDFLAGNYVFSGASTNSVVNKGSLSAAPGGYVSLMGKTVSNQGVITATLGTVSLNAGSKITLNFDGNSLVDVSIDEGVLNALVENRQLIRADGGKVILTAKAADAVLSAQVNNSGTIQARTMAQLTGGTTSYRKGSIKLKADGGTTKVSGTLDASAPNGGDGGSIETSGNSVKVDDAATITTAASLGATGTWLIDPDGFTIGTGGDITAAALEWQLARTNVTIESTNGSGADGNIVVRDNVSWSANTLTLDATNSILVNAVLAPSGSGTGLVLDAGKDITLNTALSIGAASLTGTAGGDIDINAPLSWTTGTVNLTAGEALTVNAALTGTAGSATLKAGTDLTVNDAVSLGEAAFSATAADDLIVAATVSWTGTQNVDLTATAGNLTIYGVLTPSGAGGTLTLAAGKDIDLDSALTLGSTVLTASAGTDLNVNAALSWNGDTVATLAAGDYININAPVTATGTNAGLVMNYGKDYTIWTLASYSGAVLNEDGIPVAQTPPKDAVYGSITLSGANASLTMNGQAYTLIHSMSQLAAISGVPGYYALAGDLDASGTTYTSVIESLTDSTFAGLGHTINGLTFSGTATKACGVQDQYTCGGFIAVTSSSVIRDFGLTNVTVSGFSGGYFGALVGYGTNITADQVYSTGSITSSSVSTASGLMGGVTYFRVSNSFSDMDIDLTSGSSTGLIGEARNGTVTSSHATGDQGATMQTGVAGLIGGAGGVTISYSYATGNVTASARSTYIGGLVANTYTSGDEGTSSNEISNSFATGNVTGGTDLGGLVGGVFGTTISNSYATGDVTGNRASRISTSNGVGGLVGYSTGLTIRDSFATGNVTATTSYVSGVGGLVGYINDSNYIYGYTDSSQISNSYATGTVYAPNSTYVGGFLGKASSTSVSNTFSTGDVTGYDGTGGFAGLFMNGVVTDSYSTGSVTGLRPASKYTLNGSFIGQGSQITFNGNNYYSTDIHGSVANETLGNTPYTSGNTNLESVTGLDAAGIANLGLKTGATITLPSMSPLTGTSPGQVAAAAAGAATSGAASTAAGAQSAAQQAAAAAAAAQAAAALAQSQLESAQSAAMFNATSGIQQTADNPPTASDAKAGAAQTSALAGPSVASQIDTTGAPAPTTSWRQLQDEAERRKKRAAQRVQPAAAPKGGVGGAIRAIDVDGKHFELEKDAPAPAAPAQPAVPGQSQ